MKVHMQWRGTKTSWMLCDKIYFKKRDKQDSFWQKRKCIEGQDLVPRFPGWKRTTTLKKLASVTELQLVETFKL